MGILPRFYLNWVTDRRRSYIVGEIEADRSLMDPLGGVVGEVLEEQRRPRGADFNHSPYTDGPDFDPEYDTTLYGQRLHGQLEHVMDDLQQQGRLTLGDAKAELARFLNGCERRVILHKTYFQVVYESGDCTPLTAVRRVLRIPYIPEPGQTTRKTANF